MEQHRAAIAHGFACEDSRFADDGAEIGMKVGIHHA
jgi:hypothetical protein